MNDQPFPARAERAAHVGADVVVSGEFFHIYAVRHKRDVASLDLVVLFEIPRNILADSERVLAPFRERFQHGVHLEIVVRRRDEADVEFAAYRLAHERGDARVRVYERDDRPGGVLMYGEARSGLFCRVGALRA